MEQLEFAPQDFAGTDLFTKPIDVSLPIGDVFGPKVRTVAGGEDNIREYVASALKRGWPEHKWVPAHTGELVIAGGGPSLNNRKVREKIKWRIKSGKAALFSVNGAHDHLLSHGIKSHFAALLDAKEKVKDYISPINETAYFIASQCHPLTLDKFENFRKFLYHHEAPYLGQTFDSKRNHVNPSVFAHVGLEALLIGYRLGFRTFILYGMDSSYTDGELYAYKKDNPYAEVLNVVAKNAVTGKEYKFKTNSHMACQAEDFKNFVGFWQHFVNRGLYQPISITFHGDGYLPTAAGILHHQFPWVKQCL